MFSPHHKNTSRGFPPIEFTLPQGMLTRLLVIHIKEGHKLLTKGKAQPMLFVTPCSGQEFSKSTFCQYWKALQERTAKGKFKPFTITSMRTSFVEAFTGAYGTSMDLWEGAATVMGNSTKQWHARYAPTLRQRRGQAAVDAHAGFRARFQQRVQRGVEQQGSRAQKRGHI